MSFHSLIIEMPVFEEFSEKEKKIFSNMEHALLRIKQGDLIITEGEHSRSLYLLLEGSLLITKSTPKALIRLSKINPGEIFGEMSFFLDRPRQTNVMANSDALILEMNINFFDSIKPQLEVKLMKYLIRLLVQRLDKMNLAVIDIAKLMHS